MLVLYASEIAACIGQNRYKTVSEALKIVWNRNDSIGFKKALERNEKIEIDIKDEIVKRNVEKDIELLINDTSIKSSKVLEETVKKTIFKDEKEFYKEISKGIEKSGINVVPNPDKIEDLLNIDSSALYETIKQTIIPMDEKDNEKSIENIKTVVKIVETQKEKRKEMIKKVSSLVHTERGTRDEDKIIKSFEKKTDTKVTANNSKFYKKEILDGVIVGGKIDGLTETGELIEVKNRQYRFFNPIPLYDKIQIYTYMYILSKNSCKVVQNLKGKTMETDIEFKQEFWKEIEEGIQEFVERYNGLIESEEEQDYLLE
jgi:hypothetical protein